MWRKGNPHIQLLGMLVGTATIENNKEVPQKIKLPYDPGIPLFQRKQNTNLKGYMHPYVHCSIIYNSQNMEAT